MDIPRDKNWPIYAVQCDDCGGLGCETCDQRGWLTPIIHPKGRRCQYAPCHSPLNPDHVAVYCSNTCAWNDAR